MIVSKSSFTPMQAVVVTIESESGAVTGSGILLSKRLILTAAHVVGRMHPDVVYMRDPQSGNRAAARVLFISDEADIAALGIDDEHGGQYVAAEPGASASAAISFARALAARVTVTDDDLAITILSAAVQPTEVSDSNRRTAQQLLAALLRRRSEVSGDVEALHEAQALLREALASVPAEHPDRPAMLSNLGKIQAQEDV
jgi:hypothetical protein